MSIRLLNPVKRDVQAIEATFSLPNDIVASSDGRLLYVNEVQPTTGSGNYLSIILVIEFAREK